MRMSPKWVGMWALLALVWGARAVAAPPPWAEADREARAAHARGDMPAFLAAMRAAVAIDGGSPRMQVNLACALARNGRAAEALEVLRRWAARGLDGDVERDPDLAVVRALPGWGAVAAALGRTRRPVGVEATRVVATLPGAGTTLEGVAVDPARGVTFVSSVNALTIVALDSDGRARDLVPAGRDGMGTPMGMALDPARRALWVAAMKPGALHRFDADSGAPTGRWALPGGGGLGDVALDGTGGVFASDPETARVVRLRARAAAVEPWLADGPFVSPQGMALSLDGKWLLVADWALGLFAVELASRRAVRITEPEGTVLRGLDGLVLARDGALVAVQNGIRPARVVRVRLDLAPATPRVRDVTVLLANDPRLVEPTLGALVGDRLRFVAGPAQLLDVPIAAPPR